MQIVRNRLVRATEEDRTALKTTLKADDSSDYGIVAAFQNKSQSTLRRWFGDKPGYPEILRSAAKSKGIPQDCIPLSCGTGVLLLTPLPLTELEDRIAERVFEEFLASLPLEERADLERKLNDLRDGFLRDHRDLGKMAGTVLAAQLAAQASGFGIYMFASSLVAGAASAVGMGLPFAAFIALSKGIALLIGPLGILTSLGLLVYHLLRRDLSRSMWVILHLARIRHRTAMILTVVFGHDDPVQWLSPVAQCESVRNTELLWAECDENRSKLETLPGYWLVSGATELIRSTSSSVSVLEKGLTLAREAALPSEQMSALVDCLITQIERLRPERSDECVSYILTSIPSVLKVCYSRAPTDGEAHYLATMWLAEQIATQVGEHSYGRH
jgi:hypothetical protein